MEMKQRIAAVKAAGFVVSVNQAGPLLEQMTTQGGVVAYKVNGRYTVEWYGGARLNTAVGRGTSIFEAAVNAVTEDLQS